MLRYEGNDFWLRAKGLLFMVKQTEPHKKIEATRIMGSLYGSRFLDEPSDRVERKFKGSRTHGKSDISRLN